MSKQEDGRPALKPYRIPKLVVYGDIRVITQAAGTTSKKSDGGKLLLTKTS